MLFRSITRTVTVIQDAALLPHQVSKPISPSGPSTGVVGQQLFFSSSGSVCSHNHEVQYQFDWNDGSSYSVWSSSSQSHAYSAEGTYYPRVRAHCAVYNEIISDWSSGLGGGVKITSTFIKVKYPNGGESFKTGDTMPVRWDYSPDSGSRVYVDLYKVGQFYRRLKGGVDVGNDGTHDEVLAADIPSGNNYRIKITSTSNSSISDQSDYDFAIDASSSGTTGTVTDIDGNVYKTVKIGNQWWMAENIKVTRYSNGDQIQYVTSNSDWSSLASGAYSNYNNDPNQSTVYGRLYNWRAANDGRRLAPDGWHLPSKAEWQALVANLGGESVAGGKMKEFGTSHWNYPNSADNLSNFSALPSGARVENGNFFNRGINAYF